MSYYEPANLDRRVIAYFIDYGVVWLIAIIAEKLSDSPGLVELGALLIGFIFALVYPFAKDGFLNGQGIGKRLMNLAVVDYADQTKPVTFWQSVKRNVALLIPFAQIASMFQINGHPSRRRIGDGFAKTIVVDLTRKAKGPFVPKQEETLFGVKKEKTKH